MPIPTYQAIMLPLLGLAADEKVHRVRDAVHRLELHFNLGVEERRELMPDGRRSRFSYNVAWARTYLKKAGLLEDPRRGEFRITGRGKEVLARKPEAIDSGLLQEFDEFNAFLSRSPSPDKRVQPHPDYTPEDALIAAYQTLRNSLAADLLEQVRRSSPMFFEQLVVDVLVRMGYGGSRKEAGEAIGQAGDEGIDGIIKEDRLGLDIIYIQAKRWGNTVGRPEVQRFVGALEGKRARKGVFITTSSFSREAIDYAARINTNVILIAGTRLAEFMIDHGVGVTTDATYELKRIDTDYFPEE